MGIFNNISNKKKNSWLCQVTASEVKIFLIFCYLLAFFAVLWTSVTYDISKHDELTSKIGTYFRCLANGVHDQLDCEQYRREFEDMSIKWLNVLYLLFIAFLNVSNLPLVIEYRRMKEVVVSTLGQHKVKGTEIASHMGKQSKLSSQADAL